MLCPFSYFEMYRLWACKKTIFLIAYIFVISLLIIKLLLLMLEKEIFLSAYKSVLGRLPLDLSLRESQFVKIMADDLRIKEQSGPLIEFRDKEGAYLFR